MNIFQIRQIERNRILDAQREARNPKPEVKEEIKVEVKEKKSKKKKDE